ncbi:MAG: cytosine deaminase [Natronomonas sp.]|jgi:cytosine deaminase
MIKDGYLYDRDDALDIRIRDGQIAEIDSQLDPEDGTQVIDADGNLVSPPFVDSHVHLDKALEASGDRFPRHNDGGTDFSKIGAFEQQHYNEISSEELTRNAVEAGKLAVSNGTLYMRTHVTVGEDVDGTKTMESILEARERLDDILDLQIVALPTPAIVRSERTKEIVEECLEMGADLIGGSDPATRGGDISRTLETWFELAEEYDVEIDPHIQHPGTLGMNVLNRMAEETIDHDYQGRVTASHSYCMAELDGKEYDADTPGLSDTILKSNREAQLDRSIETFADAGMKFVTCHPSTRPGMPIHDLLDADVPLGWGSDNIQDWVIRHSQPDALQGALVNAFKLDYNQYSFASNQGLDHLWNMATREGARVLSIQDEYGLREGTPGNLIVFDEQSPQWAVLNQATREYVVKAGQIIVEDDELQVDV